jgi:hypothetical protein
MLMYGQEAGAQNDFTAYGFTGILNSNRNWTRYETTSARPSRTSNAGTT